MPHPATATAPDDAAPEDAVTGSFVTVGGRRYYRIGAYDRMDPFFLSLVSASDHWLFLSTTGGLTAGRRDPDNALFPYYTDDRIHDSGDTTGPLTLIRTTRAGVTSLWEPFSSRQEGLYRRSRAMYKSVYGNAVLFEEINHDLGLAFTYSWESAEAFGFVRRSEVREVGEGAVSVEIIDGVRNVLPSGVTRRFQLEYSTLVDGYKRTERAGESKLALFRLSSVPVDNAEPSEALRVNTAWATGLADYDVLLSTVQMDAFRRGAVVTAEADMRGRRGAFLVSTRFDLDAGRSRDWRIVLDVEKDAAGVRALLREVSAADATERVVADVERGTAALVHIVGRSDGLQASGSEASVWRHFANTLFNIMRGGIPAEAYTVSRDDLARYLRASNAPLAERHAGLFAVLPDRVDRDALAAVVAGQADADLERLVTEYLPLTFSRRHGDPSRPWNAFAIRLKDDAGRPMLTYQGNWRDIFQNWEALALSYPRFADAMIAKFADSSTLDGFNPYRVLREGYEWEVPDPDDDWAFIGYWGDHQVIYLQRLLEVADRHRPGCLVDLLDRKVFTFADVPYRIRPYARLLADPRDTIDFDLDVEAAALARAELIGADGKAAVDAGGKLVRANLAEKLLIVALSKLASFVPEGGIWLNTQRPEWNDANNALVGNGLSMVTVYYLRRYLAFVDAQLAASGRDEVELGGAVADLLAGVADALAATPTDAAVSWSPAQRKALLDELGAAGERYRERVYDPSGRGGATAVPVADVRAFLSNALRHVDHAIAANRRPDGLYHAYNIMRLKGDGIEIDRLAPMLEGQVAVLSAGVLDPSQVADVLDALRASDLYRADQDSYLLYPDRDLPHFLDKNVVPADGVAESGLLTAMIARGDTRIVATDVDGGVHFNAAFRNAGMLAQALAAIPAADYGPLGAADRAGVLALYERVFEHAFFTGRSGTFYKYEGLGSTYWHMVSKLLVAVDEARLAALAAAADAAVTERLAAHYEAVRAGIGADKAPDIYGAVPTDPYSHTPSFAGVQQPGMTGQVKEDLITRMSEMGVTVSEGRIRFVPELVRRSEFLTEPATFTFVDVVGEVRTVELDAGAMGFTVCQVPVVLRAGGEASVVVVRGDERETLAGLDVGAAGSAAIFDRTGEVTGLEVTLGV